MHNTETILKDKRETAKFLGISPGGIERLMRSGLPYIKVGGLVRFRLEDINAYLESRRRVHVPDTEAA